MPSVIRIKRSTTPGSAPTSLAAGELAINIPDRLLFTSNGSTIFRIGAQYLSVANAAATYTTSTQLNLRATWAALTSTNTALRTLISDRLQVANAVATYATRSNPTTSGLLAHTGRMTISTNLAVSGNTRITGSTIIDGDLTVEGGVTYISSSTLNVDDSMVKLASNNAADTVDVGFYGKYVSAATTKWAGIFRDASDGVFKVYAELQPEPTTTVNVAGTGYTLATLDAIIDGGTY
jgi:hypothetical protein